MPPQGLPVITSTANPAIRAAADLRHRRGRDEAGLTLVDGARELRRALEAGIVIRQAFVCPELATSDDARTVTAVLEERGTATRLVAASVYSKVAFGHRADGVVCVVEIPALELAALSAGLPERPLLAVVEGLEKPGNLGAILRAADGAGIDGLVAADPRTDLFNPNAIRASIGTIFTVPLASATTAATIDWLQQRRVIIVTARVDAARPYTAVELTGPTALVLGSEAAGLSGAWRGAGVTEVRVPMLGAADSLNVATAAAVLFYEARRQRDAVAD